MTHIDVRDLQEPNPKAVERKGAAAVKAEADHAQWVRASKTHLTREDVEELIARAATAPPLRVNDREVRMPVLLAGKDVSGEDLSGLDLGGAVCSPGFVADGTNFSGTVLKGANLHGARLGDSKFKDADLEQANLSEACLCGALFLEANLRKANLSKACLANTSLDLVFKGDAKIGRIVLSRKAHEAQKVVDTKLVKKPKPYKGLLIVVEENLDGANLHEASFDAHVELERGRSAPEVSIEPFQPSVEEEREPLVVIDGEWSGGMPPAAGAGHSSSIVDGAETPASIPMPSDYVAPEGGGAGEASNIVGT